MQDEIVIRPRKKPQPVHVSIQIHSIDQALQYIDCAMDEKEIAPIVIEQMQRDARFTRTKEERQRALWWQVPCELTGTQPVSQYLKDLWKHIRVPYDIIGKYTEIEKEPHESEAKSNISTLKTVKNVHLLGSGYFGDESTESKIRDNIKKEQHRKAQKKKRFVRETMLEEETY